MYHSFTEARSCNQTSDCPAFYTCIQLLCEHKTTLFPPTAREILGSIMLVILLGYSHVGGLGGSFIASPSLMMIFNFDPFPAMRITYCTVLGGAIGNFICNGWRRRPNSRKPAIDYDAALLCVPLLVSGSSIGVIVNSTLPQIFSVAVLGMLCLLALYKTWQNAISEYRNENFRKNIQQFLFLLGIVTSPLKKVNPSDKAKIDEKLKEIKQKDPKKMKNHPLFPLRRYLQMLGLLLVVVILLLLRGGKAFHSIARVPYCGWIYWTIYALTMIFCFVFGLVVLLELKRNSKKSKKPSTESSSNKETSDLKTHENNTNEDKTKESEASKATKEEINYKTEDDRKKEAEMKKDKHQESSIRRHCCRVHPGYCRTKIAIVSFFSGVIAGVSGVGGGLILNPLFLDMGVDKLVASSTSNFLVFFTSFIGVFQSGIAGDLPPFHSVYFGALSLVGAVVIEIVHHYFVKKYKRHSYLLFFLCFVALAAALTVVGYIISRTITNTHSMVKIGSMC